MKSTKVNKCDICGKTFPLLAKLKRHLTTHDRTAFEEPKQCFYCEEKLQDSYMFKLHIHEKHMEFVQILQRNPTTESYKYKCKECEQYHYMSFYETHYRNKHSDDTLPEMFKCRYCPIEFFERSERNVHASSHLDSEKKVNFNCQECSLTFENPNSYADHYNEHYAQLQFICRYCPRRFKWAGMCMRHETRIHAGVLAVVKQEVTEEKRYIELQGWQEMVAPGPERNTNNELAYICKICNNKCYGTKLFNLHLYRHVHTEQRYECDICEYRTNSLSHLNRHKLSHEDDRPFPCEVCEMSFKNIDGLKWHSRVHKNKKQCKCEDCEQEFEDEYTLLAHQKTVHGGKHKCKFCHMKFISVERRVCHEQNVHPEELPEECNICGEKFKFFKSLGAHMQIHEPNEQECSICQQNFPDEYSLIEHANAEHDGKRFKCDICGGVYRLKRDLAGHQRYSHREELSKEKETVTIGLSAQEKKYIEMRGWMDQLTPNLERRIERNKSLLAFICKYCNKKIYGTSKFLWHLQSHGEGKFKCTVCKFTSNKVDLLQKHMKQHDDTINLTCEHCGLSFSTQHGITMHRKVHDKIDEYTYNLHYTNTHVHNYNCEFCDAGFRTEGKLEHHEKKEHYGQNSSYNSKVKLPLSCKSCHERFRLKKSLTTHMRIHEPKEETCLDCQKVFPDEYTFKEHIKEHTGYKRYKCPICEIRMLTLSGLIFHRRDKHKGEMNALTENPERFKKSIGSENSSDNELKDEEFDNSEMSEMETDDVFDNLVKSRNINLKKEQESSSSAEFTPLPMAAVLFKEFHTKENSCCIIWTKKIEPDLLTLAELNRTRSYICVMENNICPTILNENVHRNIITISVSINLDDRTMMKLSVYSFQSLQNKLVLNSFADFEDSLLKSSNKTEVVHFVRENSKSLVMFSKEIQSRKVVCNYMEETAMKIESD